MYAQIAKQECPTGWNHDGGRGAGCGSQDHACVQAKYSISTYLRTDAEDASVVKLRGGRHAGNRERTSGLQRLG